MKEKYYALLYFPHPRYKAYLLANGRWGRRTVNSMQDVAMYTHENAIRCIKCIEKYTKATIYMEEIK